MDWKHEKSWIWKSQIYSVIGREKMSKYIRYEIKNIEPIRITNNTMSQSGQMETLRYIPGSTIRGYVVSDFLKKDLFQKYKRALLTSEVRFLNAYPYRNGRELMPSLKGFYEDKTEAQGKKEVGNMIVDPESVKKGWKRASLGRFCYLENDCIYYYQMNTGSDLKIKMNLQENEKRNVFRNEYIEAGQIFVGYIAVNNDDLAEEIGKSFSERIFLGNARSAGLGKCEVVSCSVTDNKPYVSYLPEEDVTDHVYMTLLSPGVMRNDDGEYCGLDLSELENKLQVSHLKISSCSTSTVNIQGYNRTWETAVPSVVMYDAGSAFRLEFDGIITKKTFAELCEEGIGCRLNEGFGRILFIKDYDKIKYKQRGAENERVVEFASEYPEEDKKVLFLAAKRYYQNKIRSAMNRYVTEPEHSLKYEKVSRSQLGILESYATGYKYNPEEAFTVLKRYISHAAEKQNAQNVQKEKNSIANIEKFFHKIFDTELDDLLNISTLNSNTTMGIDKELLLTENEKRKIKLELITELIRYENKKGEA